MSFSGELKKRREEKGLSLRELEAKIGVSDSMLWRYERGIGLSEMNVGHASSIAKFYGWELSDMGKKIGREVADEKKKNSA